MTTTTEIAATKDFLVIPPATLNTLAKMDSIAEQGRLALAKSTNPFEKSFLLSEAMNQLRGLLTPEIMKPMMALQGSALGFKTDKDSDKGYPVEVVKDCIIEAALRGIYPVGNEFNIIAGRCYGAKNGLARLVRNYPGLTDLVMTPGIPSGKEGGTLVPYKATFNLNGVAKEVDRTGAASFGIRVNSGSIIDAIMGKAKRKMYAAILEYLDGSEISEGEVGDDGVTAIATPAAAKRAPLPNDIKDAKVTSETTVPAGDPGTGAKTPPPLPAEPKSEDQASAQTGDVDEEIKEHDRLMGLIRADQQKNGWSDAECIEILKGGYGFPKHSATIKELDDCTNKFLDMVVKALDGLNKAIEKNRTP